MISEIMDKNANTNNQITDVYKFPRAKNIKITFTKTNIAKKVTEIGLRMYSMSITPHQIQQDEFIPIKSCMKCYQIEEHNTSECPKLSEYKVCSECAGNDHTWRECNKGNKKCLNCEGEHRTLAMKCQKRRDAINGKRREKKENITYSNKKGHRSSAK